MSLPLLSGRQIISALGRLGFHESHRKGSHVKLIHADGRQIVIPFHDEVDRQTLRVALRNASIDESDFLDKVK